MSSSLSTDAGTVPITAPTISSASFKTTAPSEAHVAANRNPLRRYATHLTGRPDELSGVESMVGLFPGSPRWVWAIVGGNS